VAFSSGGACGVRFGLSLSSRRQMLRQRRGTALRPLDAVAKFVVTAETRSGRPCMALAVCGKKCCHMHGGAPGLGAPLGNQNPLEQGHFIHEAVEQRRLLGELIRGLEGDRC